MESIVVSVHGFPDRLFETNPVAIQRFRGSWAWEFIHAAGVSQSIPFIVTPPEETLIIPSCPHCVIVMLILMYPFGSKALFSFLRKPRLDERVTPFAAEVREKERLASLHYQAPRARASCLKQAGYVLSSEVLVGPWILPPPKRQAKTPRPSNYHLPCKVDLKGSSRQADKPIEAFGIAQQFPNSVGTQHGLQYITV